MKPLFETSRLALCVPMLCAILGLCAPAWAGAPLLAPTFSPAQTQVLAAAARATPLQSQLASFLGITEARLVGKESGRVSLLLAQYLVYRELEAASAPPDQLAWAKTLLRQEDWGWSVFQPLAAEARAAGTTVCPPDVGAVRCYYFVLSHDMAIRLKVRAAPVPSSTAGAASG